MTTEPRQPEDLDPGFPGPAGQGSAEGVLPQSGIDAANYGLDGKGDLGSQEAPLQDLGHPATLDVDTAAMDAFLAACIGSTPRVGYRLGAKIGPGQVPGRDFTAVDCSGFVRELMRRCTIVGAQFPDGSVIQHDWVKARGFVPADEAKPGMVYLAFLSPADTASHIGHVVFVRDGRTIESHGGVGPDSRPWTRSGWQRQARLYVVDPKS
jgi:cell wall-associated NlpC family hydrolase